MLDDASSSYTQPPQVPAAAAVRASPSPAPAASHSGLSLPKGSMIVAPKPMAGDLGDAIVEVGKLLRHAQSALNFEDTDTAVLKLKDALALLLPHRKSTLNA
jgi:hypothetical protein